MTLRGDGKGPNITWSALLFFGGGGAVIAIAIYFLQGPPKVTETPRPTPSVASTASTASTTTPDPIPPPSSIASSKVGTASSAAKKDETVLVIDTIPAHATIMIGGAKMGISPTEIKVPKGTSPITVEIRHPGYVTLKERIVPNANQRLKLTLTAAKAAPSGSSPYRKLE